MRAGYRTEAPMQSPVQESSPRISVNGTVSKHIQRIPLSPVREYPEEFSPAIEAHLFSPDSFSFSFHSKRRGNTKSPFSPILSCIPLIFLQVHMVFVLQFNALLQKQQRLFVPAGGESSGAADHPVARIIAVQRRNAQNFANQPRVFIPPDQPRDLTVSCHASFRNFFAM